MRALGIILAGGKNDRLRELTSRRALAAIPMVGSYRSIDFTLSNMSNSGINKVGVVTQYNSRSLIDHLSSSKWWDFGRKQGGLSIFTPYITPDSRLWYRGTADAIYQNLDYLKKSHEPYVVIAQGDGITKIDFNDVLSHHIKKNADITIVCKAMPEEMNLSEYGIVDINEEGRIIDFEEKPIMPESHMVSTGMYLIRRRLLIELIEQAASEERYDFVYDIIIRYRKQKQIYAYMHTSYWQNIASAQAYFQTNMDFLSRDLRNFFFKEAPYIMTKVEDEPPAKFNYTAQVSGSLCSSGCIINGRVEESILFRKVYIGQGTVIKNSLILSGTYIGDNCHIENAIIDRFCHLEDGQEVVGMPNDVKILKCHTSIE